MKEQIYTIPVNDGFDAGDECPFCNMRRQAEQRAMRYVAGPGASYMEPDVRERVAQVGFCSRHMKALYDYGNALGAALMLQTHMVGLQKELETQIAVFENPNAKGLFGKKQTGTPAILDWVKEKNGTCFLCSKISVMFNIFFGPGTRISWIYFIPSFM